MIIDHFFYWSGCILWLTVLGSICLTLRQQKKLEARRQRAAQILQQPADGAYEDSLRSLLLWDDGFFWSTVQQGNYDPGYAPILWEVCSKRIAVCTGNMEFGALCQAKAGCRLLAARNSDGLQRIC